MKYSEHLIGDKKKSKAEETAKHKKMASNVCGDCKDKLKKNKL